MGLNANIPDESKADVEEKVLRPALPEHPNLEEVEEFFKGDTFAYAQADCRITEAWKGHGVAEMVLDPKKHFNAQNHVMGGAVFTLADYAFAAATICGQVSSVTLTSTVEFMRVTKGSKLIAICDVEHSGRRIGFYTTKVVDDLGIIVARVTATCYHPKPFPPSPDDR